MEGERATVIDADASVEGKLQGKDARILGRFKGEVELTGRLVLGENARVEAKILADAVEIGGEFSGELVVRSLLLMEKARVSGMLDAQSLAVREGAQLNGSVTAGGRKAAAPAVAPKPAVAG